LVCETLDGRVTALNQRFLDLVGWEGTYSGEPLDALIATWVARASNPRSVETFFSACRSSLPPGGPVELKPLPGQVVEARFRVVELPEPCRVWSFREWRNSALAWVSHEIKNPLNAVLGFSELLNEALATERLSERARESLRGLQSGARHLQAVLGDLLDLSRLESGAVDPQPEWTSIEAFLDDLNDLFRTRVRRRGLEFIIEGPAEELDVWVDQRRLAQILSNFLVNALKFTKRGWVAVRVFHKGPAWVFHVEDSGVGVPLDQQKAIFEPFVQGQGQGSAPQGTGLGLAICRTLAHSLNGRLALESSPGEGSRFSVVFDSLESRKTPRPAVEAAPSPLPPATLLMADDEPSNLVLVQQYLRGWPVSLVIAQDGAEAIEQWKAHRPQAVLMDLRMPITSGWEAAHSIRELDPAGDTKLLAMSAAPLTGAEETEAAGLWSGFLEKPFSKQTFLKFLANHLTFVDEATAKP
jgi:two-component system sensor histidine kinase EvgS